MAQTQKRDTIINNHVNYVNFNFHELVGRPTRVTASGCPQMDVILTNVFDDFRESVAVPCACSDHHLIFSHYYARGIKSANAPKVVTFRSFRKLDVSLLSNILSDDSSWNDVFSFSDVDDCVLCFTLVLQGLLDILVPLRHLRIREGRRNPWLVSQEIGSAKYLRDRLYKRALHSGSSGDWSAFRQSHNRYTSLLRSAKKTTLKVWLLIGIYNLLNYGYILVIFPSVVYSVVGQ